MDKLLSGKFIFTVATAGVFVWSAVTGTIANEQATAIIMLVVSFYFHKKETPK